MRSLPCRRRATILALPAADGAVPVGDTKGCLGL
jgi:hypothetical protein